MERIEDIIMQEAQLDPNNSGIRLGFHRGSTGKIRKTGRRPVIPYDPLNFAPLGPNTQLYPYGDEIIIRVDRFEDEATCRDCNGSGHSSSTCTECGGNKGNWFDSNGTKDNRASANRSVMSFVDCPSCRASSYSMPIPRSTGRIPCRSCRGTGQAVGSSSLTIATDRTDEPTTGIVLAIGDQCKRIRRGDRVLFARFAGQQYEFDGRHYRIMKENYPMGRITGKAEVKVREAALL